MILQRLKNLWKLSEPVSEFNGQQPASSFTRAFKPKPEVTIIKRVEPITEFLEKNGQK